jgi:hypothetical protein
MNPVKFVLILFIISLIGLIIFYLVGLFEGSLNFAPPLVLIMVIVILGLVMTWGSVIPHNIPI